MKLEEAELAESHEWFQYPAGYSCRSMYHSSDEIEEDTCFNTPQGIRVAQCHCHTLKQCGKPPPSALKALTLSS
jgi:hypothetical protein